MLCTHWGIQISAAHVMLLATVGVTAVLTLIRLAVLCVSFSNAVKQCSCYGVGGGTPWGGNKIILVKCCS